MIKLFLLVFLKVLVTPVYANAPITMKLILELNVTGTHNFCRPIDSDEADALRPIHGLPSDRLFVEERSYSYSMTHSFVPSAGEFPLGDAPPVLSCVENYTATNVLKVLYSLEQHSTQYNGATFEALVQPWIMPFNNAVRMPRLSSQLTSGLIIDVPPMQTWAIGFFGSIRVQGLPDECFVNDYTSNQGQVVVCQNSSETPLRVTTVTNTTVNTAGLNQNSVRFKAAAQQIGPMLCDGVPRSSIYVTPNAESFSSWICAFYNGFLEVPLTMQGHGFTRAMVLSKLNHENSGIILRLKNLNLTTQSEPRSSTTVLGAFNSRIANKLLHEVFSEDQSE